MWIWNVCSTKLISPPTPFSKKKHICHGPLRGAQSITMLGLHSKHKLQGGGSLFFKCAQIALLRLTRLIPSLSCFVKNALDLYPWGVGEVWFQVVECSPHLRTCGAGCCLWLPTAEDVSYLGDKTYSQGSILHTVLPHPVTVGCLELLFIFTIISIIKQ